MSPWTEVVLFWDYNRTEHVNVLKRNTILQGVLILRRISVGVRESIGSHPISLPQPVAEPPVAEGRGTDHQEDAEDGEGGEDVACSDTVTQKGVSC